MSVLDFTIPGVFNTLDEVAYGDGVPVSAALGRELQENDRFLAAVLVKNVVCKAWDMLAPYTVQYFGIVTIYEDVWRSTPGVRTVTLRCRAIITAGYTVAIGIVTDERLILFGASAVVGTGAEQDFEVAGVRIRGGQASHLAVYVTCGLEPTGAADVTGAVSDVADNRIVSVGLFGPIAVGWAIRLEEGGGGNRRITRWHTIIRKVSNDVLIVRPDWAAYENASGYDSSGAAQFRARQIAEFELLSLSVDENPRTGQW